MNNVTLWNPFGMIKEFEGAFRNPAVAALPKTDIAETDDGYEITLEVSGVDSKDLSLEVKDGILTVSGEKKAADTEDGKNYVRMERTYGKFSRAFRLPEGTAAGDIKADCKNGVLVVKVPAARTPEPETVKIAVN